MRTMVIVKTGDLVQLGDELAGAEEYLGDVYSTFIQDGKIYASTPGFIFIDNAERKIKVDNKMDYKRTLPKKGDEIIGTIVAIRKNSVGVQIQKLNDNLIINSGIYGNIHVSNVSRDYVDKLENVFQVTDILRAKVLGKEGSEWKLTTNQMNTGVLHTECKFCGKLMERKGKNQVVCPFCNNMERRVLAPDYNMVNDVIKF